MAEIFLSIINMSVSASWVLLAVLVLRLLLKKAPKWITVILWGVVAVRLICPFSIESIFSLIPSAETVSPGIMTEQIPTINTGIPSINSTLNPIIGESFTPTPGASANPLQIWIPILAAVWLAGVAVLLAYVLVSYIRVKRRIGTAVLCRDNIWQSENVVSPFVLGLIKPQIYLPFSMREQDMDYVLAHEQAHIRRKDHLWKPFGFLLLALHWFNPFVWLGYILLCRDIELACDEKVIKELDHDARADYSEALLTCSVNRRLIAACPLAFGEVGVRERVKSVLNYKKPAFWIIIGAVVICIVVAVCFLTNPPQKPDDPVIFTEYEGVYLAVNAITVNADGHGTFDLVMYNNTENQVTYGSAYIQRKNGDRWVSLALDTLNSAYGGFLLNPDSAEHLLYTTMKLDVSTGGTYRLVIPFSVDDGKGDESYNAWVEFNADDLPITENNGRYTEYTGVYLRTDTIDINTEGHYVFKLVLYNNTDKQVTYGLNYFIQRKDGDEWVGVATEDLIFVSVAYRLNPECGEVLTYTSEKFDLSKPGTYRLVVPFSIDEGDGYKDYKTWVEFKTDALPTAPSLQEKYPQFYGLNTEEGLTVYVQVSTDEWYLFSTGTDDRSVLSSDGASMEEMRMIVASYNIDRERIQISVPNVFNSGQANESFQVQYESRFWSLSPSDDILQPYDMAIFDVDNDGVEEVCSLMLGNTSDITPFITTFEFRVREVGNIADAYYLKYSGRLYDVSFQEDEYGVVRLRASIFVSPVASGTNKWLPEIHLFDITIVDGHVHLTENGVPIDDFLKLF